MRSSEADDDPLDLDARISCSHASLPFPPAPREPDRTRSAHPLASSPSCSTPSPDGVRVSPTLRRLVDALEASDVVVYLTFDRRAPPNTAGHISFVAAVAGPALSADLDRPADVRLPAPRASSGTSCSTPSKSRTAPWVTDDKALAALYRRHRLRQRERSRRVLRQPPGDRDRRAGAARNAGAPSGSR